MVKSFLIILFSSLFAFGGEQIILVVAQDYNATRAKLLCYEDQKRVLGPIEVNVGAKGVGFGADAHPFFMPSNAPQKREGDKKAPIGIFTLDSLFGYEANSSRSMSYLHATKELICVDDATSKFYNQIIKKPNELPKSFEEMRREDKQYLLGVTVGYNKAQLANRGSCIFMHVEKSPGAPTAGCTSMALEDLQEIATWLDPNKKPILVQITKAQAKEAKKLYPFFEIEE